MEAIFENDYKVLAFFIKPVNENIELTASKGYGRPGKDFSVDPTLFFAKQEQQTK